MKMPTRDLDGWVLLFYAIAAVSGGMGGCASALYYVMHGQRRAGMAFVCAYTVLGIIFGVITLAGLAIYQYPITDVNHLVLWAAGGGAAGSVALATTNWTVRAIFKQVGIDVELTFRRSKNEERRDQKEVP